MKTIPCLGNSYKPLQLGQFFLSSSVQPCLYSVTAVSPVLAFELFYQQDDIYKHLNIQLVYILIALMKYTYNVHILIQR